MDKTYAETHRGPLRHPHPTGTRQEEPQMKAEVESVKGAITTKRGLLWRRGKIVPLPEADEIAHDLGFTCAEQLVRHLEKQKTGGVSCHNGK